VNKSKRSSFGALAGSNTFCYVFAFCGAYATSAGLLVSYF